MSPWLLLYLLPFPVCWFLAFRFILRDLHDETEVDVEPLNVGFAALAAFIFTWLWPIGLCGALLYIPLKPFARRLVDVKPPRPKPRPHRDSVDEAVSRLHLQQLALRLFQLFPVEYQTLTMVAVWMGVPDHQAEQTLAEMTDHGTLVESRALPGTGQTTWALSSEERKAAIEEPVVNIPFDVAEERLKRYALEDRLQNRDAHPDERMEQALSRVYLSQFALRRFQLSPSECRIVPEIARWMGVPEHLAERTLEEMAQCGVLNEWRLPRPGESWPDDQGRWSLTSDACKDAIAHPVIDPNLR